MLPAARDRSRSRSLTLLLLASIALAAVAPALTVGAGEEADAGHLVISEVSTGGASASDELIELYNPTATALPLEGLELVYVTATGTTVSRRAAWELGAPTVPPGHHVLIAHASGIFAAIADAVYASGMAAGGGSVALRIQGAASAIDAVGWGTAASAWMEGGTAVAPPVGGAIERLPGGGLGSTQDTDDNAADFVAREVPDPRNLGSAPVPDPSAPTLTPVPSTSLTPTPAPTPGASSTSSQSQVPEPAVVPIVTARGLPDGSSVTVEGVALTGSHFSEGGGYLVDGSNGIALLAVSGEYARGDRLRVVGEVEDRFAQRTLRVEANGIERIGTSTDEPLPLRVATGEVGESVEAALVEVAGVVAGAPTSLSAGLAFDVDDGTGAVRVLVGSATGIDTGAWSAGAAVRVVGVVGQRDSSGTGAAGYRVQPRDAADVVSVEEPAVEPSGTPDAPSGSPEPSATPPAGVVSIADARAAAKNARVTVRGTVTLAPGLIDPVTAAIQDATGAILLRLGDEAGPLARGDLVEVDGVRSTKSGMETLRVTAPARRLGSGTEPSFVTVATGQAAESLEARLVVVRGAVTSAARRASSGTVSLELDDGSGPIRVVLAAPLGAETAGMVAGAWVEARGVLGQETTGAHPLRGYRIWPRAVGEVRVVAPVAGNGEGGAPEPTADGITPGGPSPAGALAGLDVASLGDVRVGATLVAGPWSDLGVAGILWDGERLVAIAPSSAAALSAVAGTWRGPRSLALDGLKAVGSEAETGIPMVALGKEPGDVVVDDRAPAPPLAALPRDGTAAWVTLLGPLVGRGDATALAVGGERVRVERRCHDAPPWPANRASVTGIAVGSPLRLVVPCDGVRPVPTLSRGTAAAPTNPALDVDGAGSPIVEENAPEGRAAMVTAALLGLAAALFGGIAVAARVSGETSVVVEENAPAEDAEERPGGTPPVLTLVAVPREHGP